MSGLGTISGLGGGPSGLGLIERPKQKIQISCDCGRRYRVPASRAGSSVRCKACRGRIRVPATPESLSSHEAGKILAELGIDASSARAAYEERVECFYCAGKLTRSETEALVEGEPPVCLTCRASTADAQVAERQEPEQARRPHKELKSWVRARPVDEARKRAAGYAGLFLVGIAGLGTSVLGLGLGASLILALAVSAGGGYHVYCTTLEG